MQLGQVVDFCIAYNQRQKEAEKETDSTGKRPHKKKRKGTQADIDAFFG